METIYVVLKMVKLASLRDSLSRLNTTYISYPFYASKLLSTSCCLNVQNVQAQPSFILTMTNLLYIIINLLLSILHIDTQVAF